MRPDKPSNTALMVAAGLQLVPPHPATDPHLPTEAITRGAALLQAADPRFAAMLRKPWFRRLCHSLEHATLAGISLHFALRKRTLRNHAHTAVAAGCTQVVVLGAGLDTLCMELHAAWPDLRCIEIDHPASQAVKQRAAGPDGEGITFIGADLAQQALSQVLSANPVFAPDAPTLFVAEGLLMYVPLAGVAELFRQMAKATPGCSVAFTWLEPQADGKPNFKRPSRVVDLYLKLRGEPLLSSCLRSALPGFLAEVGFALDGIHDSVELLSAGQRAALGPDGLPIAGEYIAFAHALRA
ncbi:MAG: class I SAM-dependent methyltransferase [Massilia sp.]